MSNLRKLFYIQLFVVVAMCTACYMSGIQYTFEVELI